MTTTLIAELFSAGSATAEGIPRLVDEELYPEELAHVARAVPKRRAEFGSARILAREALAALGVAPVSLVPAADRSPVWPPGIVGSISHTRGHCAVVVHHATHVRSVGLDVEQVRPIEHVYSSIMTEQERAWLEAQPAETRNELAIVHFSAKEAYYKCQYSLTGGFLDFLDVALTLDLERGEFEARVLKDGWNPSVAKLRGRFVVKSGMVLCGVELAAT